MAKYKKKPVVIEAYKWDGRKETFNFFAGKFSNWGGIFSRVGDGFLTIQTLEGKMKASVGDFVIKGVNGEFYSCKPDIFEKTYEKVQAKDDNQRHAASLWGERVLKQGGKMKHTVNLKNLEIEDFEFTHRILSASNEYGYKAITYKINALSKDVKYKVTSSVNDGKEFNDIAEAIEYYNEISI